jgi:hypothetical protein
MMYHFDLIYSFNLITYFYMLIGCLLLYPNLYVRLEYSFAATYCKDRMHIVISRRVRSTSV